MLRTETGEDPLEDELLAKPVLAAAVESLQTQIRVEGAAVPEPEELTFSALLKLTGYLHSSHTQENPALHGEAVRLSNVFTFQEEVWELVYMEL